MYIPLHTFILIWDQIQSQAWQRTFKNRGFSLPVVLSLPHHFQKCNFSPKGDKNRFYMLSGWNEEDKYVKIVQMKLNKLNFYKLESFSSWHESDSLWRAHSRQLLLGALYKCMFYIKKHHILSHKKKKSAWGFAGRAEMLVNLSADVIIAYTNTLLNVTTWQVCTKKAN